MVYPSGIQSRVFFLNVSLVKNHKLVEKIKVHFAGPLAVLKLPLVLAVGVEMWVYLNTGSIIIFSITRTTFSLNLILPRKISELILTAKYAPRFLK